MQIRVMWTYIANFSSEAQYYVVPENVTVTQFLFDTYKFFSDDFWQKGNFHVFYIKGDHLQYAKIAAKDIKHNTMAIVNS